MSSRPRMFHSFVLSVAAAALSLVLLAPCASADGVTVTIDPTSVIVVEGQTFTLNATFTNDSGSLVSFSGGEGEGLAYVSGDPTDSPNEFGLAYGSCVTGYGSIPGGPPRFPILTTLAPGASCVLSQPVTAVPDPASENEDAGVYDVVISIDYGNGLLVAESPKVLVTVEDQSATVPEPSSLLLLGIGLLALPLIAVFGVRTRRSIS